MQLQEEPFWRESLPNHLVAIAFDPKLCHTARLSPPRSVSDWSWVSGENIIEKLSCFFFGKPQRKQRFCKGIPAIYPLKICVMIQLLGHLLTMRKMILEIGQGRCTKVFLISLYWRDWTTGSLITGWHHLFLAGGTQPLTELPALVGYMFFGPILTMLPLHFVQEVLATFGK